MGFLSVVSQKSSAEPLSQSPLGDASTIPNLTPLGKQFDLGQGHPPQNALDSIFSGRFTVRSKLRFWYAKDSDLLPSYANTWGLRVGYLTQRYKGFQAFAEVNYVQPFTSDYFDGVNGESDRTLVADVEQSELNQAWAQYSVEFDSLEMNIRAGRQASVAIEERFIGSSGSRQGEQTYDSIAAAMRFGDKARWTFEYGYIDKVHRLFDEDGLDYDSDSHATRLGYISDTFGTVSLFAVLLDFEDDAPSLSNQTYGLSIARPPVSQDRIDSLYYLGFAYQKEYGSNPGRFDVFSIYSETGISVPSVGRFSVGYELSSTDGGRNAFQYSLSTGQRLHRIADKFLTTPDDGLQDFFINIEMPYLPATSVASLNYHYYTNDEGEDLLGREANVDLTIPLSENLAVTGLVGYFWGEDPRFSDRLTAAIEFNLRF
ncbi:MAG: alginate export family protein [Verrucomicrobiota bacterium]